ncbi:MAG: hypothetical protein H0V88_02825 [Pyrinomonadaceae bacterium]|nr:hypothetical protein [Pyrinomonadaceae bacterium]
MKLTSRVARQQAQKERLVEKLLPKKLMEVSADAEENESKILSANSQRTTTLSEAHSNMTRGVGARI